MKKSILLIIFISLTHILIGQEYEAGVTIGGSNYVGDVGRTNYIYPNKLAGGAFFKYNWNPRIALKATYSFLPIEADDKDADTDFRQNRGFKFTNTIHELALGIEYNFYEYDLSTPGKTWTPYIILEMAAYNFKYAVSQNAHNQFEHKSKNAFTVPFGVGFKSKLFGDLAFSLEAKFRYSFNDELDYTTETIPALNFGDNNNDWYMFTGVSLIYTFGRPACYTIGF